MLLAAYRRDDLADPEGFVAQLGVVLEGYDDAVIVAVTSPHTGLQRRCKWLPTIAEVVEACDAEAVAKETRDRYARMPKPERVALPRYVDKSPGRCANVLVHRDAPQYSAMVEKVKKADEADWKYDERGELWVCLDMINAPAPKKGLKRWHSPSDNELREMYSTKQATE